jgi:hypothetical protein
VTSLHVLDEVGGELPAANPREVVNELAAASGVFARM